MSKELSQTYKEILEKLGWRKCEGYGRDYYANNAGDVCFVTSKGKLRPFKPWYKKGYGYIRLKCGDGIYRDKLVHRVVCATYHDNPDDLPVAHHMNHERGDNRHVNLKWVTYSENNTNRRGTKGNKGGE